MNDIEILEEILNRQIEDTEGTKIMKQAIENIIARNKELEEENEKLTNARNWYFEHFTSQACTPEQLRKILTYEYIPKSKVKEKIEEANKEIKQMEQDDIGVGFTLGNRWSDLKAKVKGWEELLQ